MPHPSHSSRFYHPHNSGWGLQIMELFTVEFSTVSIVVFSQYTVYTRLLVVIWVSEIVCVSVWIEQSGTPGFLSHELLMWNLYYRAYSFSLEPIMDALSKVLK
jgi:hypothetical protein